jgi:hypothetical protein
VVDDRDGEGELGVVLSDDTQTKTGRDRLCRRKIDSHSIAPFRLRANA